MGIPEGQMTRTVSNEVVERLAEAAHLNIPVGQYDAVVSQVRQLFEFADRLTPLGLAEVAPASSFDARWEN